MSRRIPDGFRAAEGRRFERVCFSAYSDYCIAEGDPYPPQRPHSLPKSVLNMLFGDGARCEYTPSSSADVSTGASRDRMDAIRFLRSILETPVPCPKGKYVVFVWGEMKITLDQHNLEKTVRYMQTHCIPRNHWGDVTPRIDIITPVFPTRENQPHLDDDTLVKFQDKATWKVNPEDTKILNPNMVYLPFEFRDPFAEAPAALTRSKRSELDNPRAWVVWARKEVIDHFDAGKTIVAVQSATGSGKTCFQAYLAKHTKFFQTFLVFERVEHSQKLVKMYENPESSKSQYLKINHEDTKSQIRAILEAYVRSLRGRADDDDAPNKKLCMHRSTLKNQCETILAFVDSYPDRLFLLVWDEAHINQKEDLMKELLGRPNMRIVLVTATVPHRWPFKTEIVQKALDGMPIVHGVTDVEAIEQGFSMPATFRFISSDVSKDVSTTPFNECLRYLVQESHSRNALVMVPDQSQVDDAMAKLKEYGRERAQMYFSCTAKTTDKHAEHEKFVENCDRDDDDPLEKNVLVVIYMADVGSDYPAVDTVVYLRSLDEKAKTSNLEAWQQLDQRQRNRRTHPRKVHSEMILIQNAKNLATVGSWISERDPEWKYTQVFTYSSARLTKEIPLEWIVNKGDSAVVDALEHHSRVHSGKRSKKEAKDDKKILPWEFDAVVNALLNEFPQEDLGIQPKVAGRVFPVRLQRRGENVELQFRADTWREKMKKLWTERKHLKGCTEDRIRNLREVYCYVTRPSRDMSVSKPEKPADYDQKREQLGDQPFLLSDFETFDKQCFKNSAHSVKWAKVLFEDCDAEADAVDAEDEDVEACAQEADAASDAGSDVESDAVAEDDADAVAEDDADAVAEDDATYKRVRINFPGGRRENVVLKYATRLRQNSDLHALFQEVSVKIGAKDTARGGLRSIVSRLMRYQETLMGDMAWFETQKKTKQEVLQKEAWWNKNFPSHAQRHKKRRVLTADEKAL